MKRTNKLVGEMLGMIGSIVINSMLNLTLLESNTARFLTGFCIAALCVSAGAWVMTNVGVTNKKGKQTDGNANS